MFTLSSALVAYGFLADTDVAAAYLGVVLPIVFVLGVFTWERLVQTALENIIAVAAIQRIRRYYATLLPGADYFFPQPTDRTAVHALALHEAGLVMATSIVLGALAGLVLFITLASYQLRQFRRVKAAVAAASG